MNYFKLLLLLFCSTICSAQTTILESLLVPDELSENANSIIVDSRKEVHIEEINKMVVKRSFAIKVLNKQGLKALSAQESYDDDTKIVKIEAEISYLGLKPEKIKKSEFQDVSAVTSGQLYTENRVKYLDFTPKKFPVLINFSSEVHYNSTAFIPPWIPVRNYNQSVMKSEFAFYNNTAINFRKKEQRLNDQINFSEATGNIQYTLENFKALEYEEYAPSFVEIIPMVRLALNEFSLKDVEGKADNWQAFGVWQENDLLSGRDAINQETKTTIDQLVAGASNEREKIKRIYQYVQQNTRYVGVQLGIGGWQPITADEVDKVKYGDCKGLTNYTKALLKTQGINSYYSVVYAGSEKRNLDKSFASMQGNHVILCVPQEKDSIWLECTSQKIPFGFLGTFTDDRDVLVVNGSESGIVRTPKYLNNFNALKTKAEVKVNEDGSVKAQVKLTSKGTQYNSRYYIASLSKEEKEDVYQEYWSYLNNMKVTDMQLTNNEEEVILEEEVTVAIEDYWSKSGNLFLVQPNMFNRFLSKPNRYKERKLPFKISRGFSDSDEFIIELPETHTIENLGKNINEVTKFGSYSYTLEKLEERKIKLVRELELKEGSYPPEEYEAFSKFLKKVIKSDKSKIVLIKN